MASYTPNLNLILPVGTEKVSRQIINSNNGIIDSAVGNIVAPTVQGVSTLAELKTYLLAVAGSAEARKNVPVQFNLTAAASPFSSGLYTGIMQKETNGAFSVLCHGYNGGVVEVQYASSTWTIMNLTSEISQLNSNLTVVSSSMQSVDTSLINVKTNVMKKYGKVVVFDLQFGFLTMPTVGTEYKIGTMPSGFSIPEIIEYSVTGAGSLWEPTDLGTVKIKVNSEVTFTPRVTATTNWYKLNISFICN